MRSYFHFVWGQGEHLIRSRGRERQAQIQCMPTEAGLLSLTVCFAKSRWERHRHEFFSLFHTYLLSVLLIKRNTQPDTVFSLPKDCGVRMCRRGWRARVSFVAQRDIQDKNYDKNNNFQDLRPMPLMGELYWL